MNATFKKVIKVVGLLLLCAVLFFVVSIVRYTVYNKEERKLKNYLEGLDLQTVDFEPKKISKSVRCKDDSVYVCFEVHPFDDYIDDVFKAKSAVEEYCRTNYAGEGRTVTIDFASGFIDHIRMTHTPDASQNKAAGADDYSIDKATFQCPELCVSRLKFGSELKTLTLQGIKDYDDINALDSCTSLEYLCLWYNDDNRKVSKEIIDHLLSTHPGCTIVANGETVTASDTTN